MLTDATADIDEVARALGKTPQWLRRSWLSYSRQTGFPRKLPHTWVWPRRAVEAWIAGRAPAPANQDAPGTEAAARTQLSQRYGGWA